MNHTLTRQNTMGKFIRIIVFGLIGISYLFFLAGFIYEAVTYPRVPQRVTLAQAVEMDQKNTPDFLVFDKALYVTITDSVWQCASIKQSGYKTISSDKRRTDAVFTDKKRTAVVFIQLFGFYSCPDLKVAEISGELDQVYTRPVKFLSDTTGTTVIDHDSGMLVYRFRVFKPLDAVLNLIFFIGFALFVWGFVRYRRRGR